ncbi:MAG: DciA family protein [Marinobacter sp.]|uniref:DciA family protein n=1 Tax=Marinobacter sp. TaxID=50741 RepID=UPI00299E719A|nr:DciA family protein [Marinobacter sp.]MDX1635017.1 DciA family protein [Marinobacter sp.]
MKKKPGLELRSDSIAQSPTLRELLARAEVHREAEKQVLRAIPETLAGKVRFVSIRDGDITLSTESSALASQLRLRQHEVMEKLREYEDFRYVWRLRVKVVPPRFREQSRREKVPLSNENARLLKEEAGHTKDKNLREVLEKLASHVRD